MNHRKEIYSTGEPFEVKDSLPGEMESLNIQLLLYGNLSKEKSQGFKCISSYFLYDISPKLMFYL